MDYVCAEWACPGCVEWDCENESCKQGQNPYSCETHIQESFSELKDIFKRELKLIDYHNLYKLIYGDIVTTYLVFIFDNFIHKILEAVKNKEKINNLEKFCEETFHKIISRFNEREDYLNDVFDQFTGNVQNEDLPINRHFIDLYYPQFKINFETLKTTPKRKPFITETDDGLQWMYSKKSLSQYFGFMPKPGRSEHKWRIIEKLFNVTDLKNSFTKKFSKDYELLLGVLENTPYHKQNTPKGK
jgi:hypothetical protein